MQVLEAHDAVCMRFLKLQNVRTQTAAFQDFVASNWVGLLHDPFSLAIRQPYNSIPPSVFALPEFGQKAKTINPKLWNTVKNFQRILHTINANSGNEAAYTYWTMNQIYQSLSIEV